MANTAPTARTGELVQWACTLEVLAPKAGNVHPAAAFADMDWRAFLVSASVIRPAFDAAPRARVGTLVLRAITATRDAAQTNTNLGMVLLLAVAAKARPHSGAAGIRAVLGALRPRDCRDVYAAIRLAQPGGLGKTQQADVHGPPPADLIAAMRLAAGRDDVARQYVNAFADVRAIARDLVRLTRGGLPLDLAIATAHLGQIARQGDSLIMRKLGEAASREAQRRAAAVLQAGYPRNGAGRAAFARFDRWLRARGNQRNPGASADLVAAGLFLTLRDGAIRPPFVWQSAVSWPIDEGADF